MQVPVDADEGLLHEILGPLAVTDRAIDEVQEPVVVTLHELAEGALVTVQEGLHDLTVCEATQHAPVVLRAFSLDQLQFAHASPLVRPYHTYLITWNGCTKHTTRKPPKTAGLLPSRHTVPSPFPDSPTSTMGQDPNPSRGLSGSPLPTTNAAA